MLPLYLKKNPGQLKSEKRKRVAWQGREGGGGRPGQKGDPGVFTHGQTSRHRGASQNRLGGEVCYVQSVEKTEGRGWRVGRAVAQYFSGFLFFSNFFIFFYIYIYSVSETSEGIFFPFMPRFFFFLEKQSFKNSAGKITLILIQIRFLV